MARKKNTRREARDFAKTTRVGDTVYAVNWYVLPKGDMQLCTEHLLRGPGDAEKLFLDSESVSLHPPAHIMSMDEYRAGGDVRKRPAGYTIPDGWGTGSDTPDAFHI